MQINKTFSYRVNTYSKYISFYLNTLHHIKTDFADRSSKKNPPEQPEENGISRSDGFPSYVKLSGEKNAFKMMIRLPCTSLNLN